MSKRIGLAFVLVGLGILGLWWRGTEGYLPPEGVQGAVSAPLREHQVREDPQQKNLWRPRTWSSASFRFRAVAEFAMTGKVLIKTDFSDGTESLVSPVDLTFGWGPMATDEYLKNISLGHNGRFYSWEVTGAELDGDIIARHSANMHMIPKNARVDRALRQIQQGELVSIVGYLVNLVSEEDGYTWNSSTTRSDTGAGACEVVWVDQIYR